ncbi:MAG: sugar phosphorylase [Hespellia sp.]|nr:sugar phosphorylase [Hespellia sp.]
MGFEERIKKRLQFVYKTETKAEEAWQKLSQRLQKYSREEFGAAKEDRGSQDLTQADAMLITYGDTIVQDGEPALETLSRFLKTYVKDAIPNVHLLPMYPYSSDDGFSVIDYKAIDSKLGSWKEIGLLAENYSLMFDAVVNHISQESNWFQKYLECEEPYKHYFITSDPDLDYSKVTRPRALPLLSEFETAEGQKHVWTTFSRDQIDLNYECPEVLAEIVDLLVFYERSGARFIRLDAIGFMWKEVGTTCIHHPCTHEIIKLMKDVLCEYAPGTKIITETNVPHEDNIRYFGDGTDEADLVYQFPLPPLTMYTLLTGDASILSKWMSGLELPGNDVTFFNFLSSHDGIGVRPTEGILNEEQQNFLMESTLRHGGQVSYKDNGDGTKSPYELNINYQDALAGPEDSDEIRIGRFLAAQTILLSMQGVPGIYIHSLLGSRNDYYGMNVSGIWRRINREKLDYEFVRKQLDGDTNRSRIFWELIRRLQLRGQEAAFAPQASQEVKNLDVRVLALQRTCQKTGERILALVNVSDEKVSLELPGVRGKNLLATLQNYDKEEMLYGAKEVTNAVIEGTIVLHPYEAAWIKVE